MRLYYSPTSPYVRKVMVLLHETEQLASVELVTASGTPLAPAEGLPAANPLSKVPALERPEGPTLYDSRVITQFLDTRAQAGLYPRARYFDVLTLEATADGILDAALLMVYESRLRPEPIRFPEWVEGQWAKIDRALDALNTRWMSHLNGPLDAGQIAVACALGYLDFRHDARDWRRGRDALAAWFEAFSRRPSMVQTAPAA
ncbi:putative GST-like protein YibF [Pseudoruegeria aquimaris]|uniref:Putative GST-like protein YibF n=1 Tax=Pseudoruegeria aquimaris TaxID=393663 RepID=A0A1Y5S2H1_9RHOB|nr:glutathione S-transferase [Pseudoruegeria aquimaris]SLN28143.1 putative GST-like protein YibF [Pseudoruegeria aquimaris]